MTFEDVKRIRKNPIAESWDILELHNLIDIAIEKQIPKKPIAEERKDYEGNIFEVAYRCPKCDRIVCCDYENDIKEEYPYCHCGQALDWGDS